MRRTLVTGAGGFIGRHVVSALTTEGDQVLALSRSAGSLFDREWLQATLRSFRPTHLIHLAWTATPGLFWEDPANDAWATMSEGLVAMAIAAGVSQIVALGTSAEYVWDGRQCDERSTPILPASAYGKAKAAFHAAARPLCEAAEIPLTWLRLFFPYGPGEPAEKFLSGMIASARMTSQIILRDPARRLDLIHIDDVIAAICRVLELGHDGALNVAVGRGVILRDLAAIVAAATMHRGTVRIVEEVPRMPAPDVIAHVERLRSLGWEPQRELIESVTAMTNMFESTQ
ncbi:MAG: NAD-dependent epimerase/dehydratase family protein [Vulcanimicrobiaceae bacterium]